MKRMYIFYERKGKNKKGGIKGELFLEREGKK